MASRYPRFHKYVSRVYIGVVLLAIIVLLSSSFIDDDISTSAVIMIGAFLVFVYVVYWVIVRLNCYGTRNLPQRRRGENANQGTVYSQGNRSSTSMRSSSSPQDTYQTFANYRFGAFSNRLRSFNSFASSITSQQRNNNNNGDEESRNDNDTTDDQYIRDVEQVLTSPPPTYTKALQDAGFPPPYISKTSSLDDRTTHTEDETQPRPTSYRTFTSSSLESAPGSGRESGIQAPSQSYRPNSNGNVVAINMDYSSSLHDSVPLPPVRPIPSIPISNNSEIRPHTRQISSIPEQNDNEIQGVQSSRPPSQTSADIRRNSGSPSSSVINNHPPTRPVPPIPYPQTTTTSSSNTSPSTLPEQNATMHQPPLRDSASSE